MKKILIANRGEIAVRIMKTCREMGIATVAVVSEADRGGRHAREADEWVEIGPGPAAESYLCIEKIIAASRAAGADGVHPGFGFLSENAAFAQAVRDANLLFIGPEPATIALMGSKSGAKKLMAEAGVPVVPGYHGEDQDPATLEREAAAVGYPLLIKASAGGGGKGMRVVAGPAAFAAELAAAKREAKAAFGDDSVLLERYLQRPRHIEFQVFGDNHGNLVHLFERECSIQRRHQKVLEETPSPVMQEALRAKMAAAAVAAARSVAYRGAGTVEFMLDEDGSFYFLEMNTRLQVEHPITEMITGVDLVRWQIEVARGGKLPLDQAAIQRQGHAIEVRVYAEDPQQQFFPQTGTIIAYREPDCLGVRVDSGIGAGDRVGIFYDPMLAKVVAHARTREEARCKLANALAEFCLHGVRTNISFLKAILEDDAFIAGATTTDYLNRHFPDLAVPEAQLGPALALTALAGAAAIGHVPTAAGWADPWATLGGWRAGP